METNYLRLGGYSRNKGAVGVFNNNSKSIGQLTAKLVSLVVLVVAMLQNVSVGQLAIRYDFAATSGTYVPIATGTGATAVAINGDDLGVNITALSPAFVVNGVSYTNARMISNGQLILYNTTAPTVANIYVPLSTASGGGASTVVIAPFGADLNGASGTAVRQTIGSVHIFQWNNFTRFSLTDALNFQVRLNTATGQISFVYGTMTASASALRQPQVGWKTNGTVAANWATDVNNLMIDVVGSANSCTWANAVTANSNTSTMYFNSANNLVRPVSGQTFTWTPQTPLGTGTVSPIRTFAAVSAITSAGATLSWTAPAGATSYDVQYRIPGSCTWTNWTGNPVATNSVSLTGLASATIYQVQVRAKNGAQNSIYSHIPPQAGGTGTMGYIAAGTFTTAALVPTISSLSPLTGCPGSTITIDGTNLTGATAANVRIGGTAVTAILTNTGTQITASVGTGTTGVVTVITSGGTATSASTFTVPATPTAPTSAAATATTATSTNANWAASAGATQYFLDVSTVATFVSFVGVYNNLNVGNVLTYPIAGLTANTTYFYRIRASNGTCASLSSANQTFFTGYCVPNSGSNCTFGDLIASVQLNTLTNNSGSFCPAAGYIDYTSNGALTTTLMPSSLYNVVIGTGAYGQDFAVWIDYNDDLVFDNITERVGYTIATVPANSTASFTIALACTPPSGNHRMRVRSAYTTPGVNITACGTQTYGEVEDYLITIAAPPACPSPGAVGSITLAVTSASLTWATNCSAATNYDFQYGLTGFVFGSGTILTNQAVTISAPNASYNLTGLASNTAYQVYYRANCGGSGTSAWSVANAFTTLCATAGDQVTYGSGSWIGYVYNSGSPGAFTTYKGVVTEPEIFDRSHVTAPVGVTTNLCPGTNSNLFAIRYRMTKSFAPGNYVFTIGGDDGVRMSLDGGSTFHTVANAVPSTNSWIDQGYTTYSSTAPIFLSGSINLVLEYYDNSGTTDRVSFNYISAPVISSLSSNAICPNSQITINGSNFINVTGASGVTFNGVNATSYIVVNSSTITAVVPSAVTAGVVTVTNNVGGGNSTAYTVNAFPAAPTVTASGSTTINIGGAPTLNVVGAGGNISWYSVASGGTPVTGGNSLAAGTPYNQMQCTSGNITLYAEEAGASCPSPRTPISFTVRPLITTDPGNALICTTGGNVVLSGNVTGGSALTWSPNTNLSTTSGSVTTASPSVTTQYTFSATVSGCGAQSGTINVGVIPSVSFTPTATPASLCEGGTSVLASNLASAGFTYSTTAFAMALPSSPTNLAAAGVAVTPLASGNLDDGGWQNIPIGFTYNFFGNNYSVLNIGTNGVLQFGAYDATSLGDYTYSTPFPTATEPPNIIAAAANDFYAAAAGTIRYWIQGIAPTRTFVAEWNAVPGYTTNGSMTVQVKLFETTGNVEIHVQNASSTINNKVVGLQNASATVGATAYSSAATISNTAWKFIPGAAYTFQWSVGGSNASGASTSTSYTTPVLSSSGPVTYTVAATNPLTQCASTQPVTITVNPRPTAPISGGDITACSNITPQTLSVTPPTGCTIDWYAGPTGGPVLTGGTGTATFSATTANTYYAQSRNTTTGCTSPTRTAVVYTQNPAPAPPTVTTPVAFCQNSIPTALTATGAGSNTFNWYTVATSGIPTSSTPLTTTATTLSYYVSQVDAGNSCESNRALITVKINATPAAPATAAAGPYCQNAVAAALSATPAGANSLTWYTDPTAGPGSGTAITPATTATGPTAYYVSQTAAYALPTIACESPRASISVVVNPNISASVNNSSTTTSLCAGGNIGFTATPTNPGATPIYQWQVNGVNVGTNSTLYTLTPQLFSDNGGDGVYSSGLSNGLNGGSGFGAWSITAGASTGTFIGDPVADLNGNAGIGSNAFGMYATGSSYLNALRPINGGMQVGDILSFYWIFNFDANGGSKGFDFKNGGTNVFNVNNGGSPVITTTAGTADATYGTTPMLVTLERTSATQYAFSMTSRSGGATYTTTISNSTSIDGIDFYIGNQNDAAGERNMYVNNLVMKKYYEVLVTMTPSAQTCLTSGAATPSNTIVLSYAPSTPAVAIVAGASTTICPGTSLSFSISSSANLGSTPSYQWKVNGTDVSGANSATFSSTSLVGGDIVSLVATSSIGGGCLTASAATSNSVSVTVQSSTAISTQPVGVAACLGASVVLTGAATGTGTISYQWFKSSVAITGNPTAITNSLTLSGLVAGSAATYYLVATGTCGSATSNNATLTLNPNTAVSSPPTAVIQCAGTNASFNVIASGFGTLTYQWRKNGTPISGATTDTYNLTNIQAADAGSYSVSVTGGCSSVTPAAVALTVNQLVSFVSQPAPTPSICAGSPITLTASVTGAGTLSYQWQLAGTNVPSATSSSLLISNPQANGSYTLIATSSLCGSATSNVSALTVNPVTAITTQPIGVTLCNGADAVLNVVTAGIGTINYQWKYGGTNITGATSPTLTLNNVTNSLNAGSYSVVVSGGTCSSGAINSTTVSLNIQSPSNSVAGAQTATCVVKGTDWIHFYTSDGKLLVSVKATTASGDLGAVTATSFVGSPQITTSCFDPVSDYYKTAVLGRNWYINPTNNLPATVRLPITNAEVAALVTASASTTLNPNDNVFSIANVNLSKYNGLNENGSWQDNCNSATNVSLATSNVYITQVANGAVSVANGFIETIAGVSYVEFNIPGFSEFWLMNSIFNTPLPVEITSLTASCTEKQEVAIKWSTASEQNSDKFIIERSRDLSSWEFVSEVAGAGNSNYLINYDVLDTDPLGDVSYYRIVQVDMNGEEKIYGPISVSCSGNENAMIVFPNPTNGNFTVEISTSESISNAELQVTDLTGKVISTRTANLLEGKNQFTFEGLDLQLGTYIINLKATNGKINPVRVVVN